MHTWTRLVACGVGLAAFCAPAQAELEVVLRPVARTDVDFTDFVRFDDGCPPALNNRRDYAFVYLDRQPTLGIQSFLRRNDRVLVQSVDAPAPQGGLDLADNGTLVWAANWSTLGPAGVYLLERGEGPPIHIVDAESEYALINDRGTIAYIDYETPMLRFASGDSVQLSSERAFALDLNDNDQVVMYVSNSLEPLVLWSEGSLDRHHFTEFLRFSWTRWPILSLNESGQMAFYNDSSRTSIVAGSLNALETAVEPDLIAPPDAPPDTLESVLDFRPHITSRGDIVFMGTDVENRNTLYLKNDSGVHRIAGEGDELTLLVGTRRILSIDLDGHFAANDVGDVLFTAVLGDPAVPGFISDRAVLLAHVQPDCPAELTGDVPPVIDTFDLLTYLDLWFAHDGRADLTIEVPAHVDVFDLLAYLDTWFTAAAAGGQCP